MTIIESDRLFENYPFFWGGGETKKCKSFDMPDCENSTFSHVNLVTHVYTTIPESGAKGNQQICNSVQKDEKKLY